MSQDARGGPKPKTYDHVIREARFKGKHTLEILHLIGGEADLECFNVVVEMFNFSPTDNREDVRRLVHDIRDRTA